MQHTHIRPLGVPTGSPVLRLEQERDKLTARVLLLTRERDPLVVEGFEYTDAMRARRVRGRLMCSLLRRIDVVNQEICTHIAPEFAPTPSVGFSERVLRLLPTEAA